MAFRHGKNGRATVNGVNLTAYLDEGSLSIENDTAETTTFGNSWKTHIAGLNGGELELSGNYDPTATTGPVVVFTGLLGADPFPVIWEPGGNAVGQIRHTFNAVLTSYEETSSVGDKVTISAGLLTTGAVTTIVIP